MRSLAEALEISVDELLEGVSGASRSTKIVADAGARTGVADLLDDRMMRTRPMPNATHTPTPPGDGPLLRLLPQTTEEVVEPTPLDSADIVSEPWVVPERPPLDGWIPDGWQPAERIQDITPTLPDGYWLDPVKLEKSTARRLLRSRLCGTDKALVDGKDVPGAALAERLYQHCSREDGFVTSGRLPLAETIFRCVLSADHGGLTDGALVEMLRERASAVPVSTTLLRRLRDSVRPYPIRRVDADLFGGRR